MRQTFTLRKSLRQIFSREFFSLSGEFTNVLCEARGRVFEGASSRRLTVLPLAEFFHADFVSFATENPPIDVPEPRGVAGAAAMLPQRNQVALFQCHDQFAAVATVTVFVDGHAPDSFVQRGHSARSVCLGRVAAFAGWPSVSSNLRISV